MSSVNELVNSIKSNVSQQTSSKKDEVLVMREMLNDRDYEVGVYTKDGQVSTYNPCKDTRSMLTSIISAATKISTAEAEILANEHDFSKAEAETMVNVSKEFINTYITTGRKLPLGGREFSNVNLSEKDVKPSTKFYPKKVGEDENGKAICEKVATEVKGYKSISVSGGCPDWIK